MKVDFLFERIKKLGIECIIGIPDSTLKEFSNYLNNESKDEFKHYIPENEGATVGLAAGFYLATRKPSCIYMQNSGIGNALNPIVSLLNDKVYSIPALFVIGWRGEPGVYDEPQHRFQGEITRELLNVLNIKNRVIDKNMNEDNLNCIFKEAKLELENNKQFAIIVRMETFESQYKCKYRNSHSINREDSIKHILKYIESTDMIVSTTGKISRELYEQSNMILGRHDQSFFTVGSMGHASMIALGIAKRQKDKRVYCIDGDGSVLMHMGSLAFIAKENPRNLIHIILNNEAHESVGGFPTCAEGCSIKSIARACGYKRVYLANTLEELDFALKEIIERRELTLIEVKVNLESRKDLGRPNETAKENKEMFMKYHNVL
ncbi:phosphonopyruvate decarboxylase [Clostridium butyricum]|uniref:phosphonopyruvate decarboxylase n=1 Tax=Clostridium butyricum TaxID=1492 RepID=UPI00374E5098